MSSTDAPSAAPTAPIDPPPPPAQAGEALACPNCQAPVASAAASCPACGASFEEPQGWRPVPASAAAPPSDDGLNVFSRMFLLLLAFGVLVVPWLLWRFFTCVTEACGSAEFGASLLGAGAVLMVGLGWATRPWWKR